jgi:uncharacterized phage protein (TIGR02218 family)
MAYDLMQGPRSLLQGKVLRPATLWRVERKDGLVLCFTDHDRTLLYESELYYPAGGFDASARQKRSALRERNLSLMGVISGSEITAEDIKAGRYREARVKETLVDWMYPFAGSFFEAEYWIVEISWSGEQWEAEMSGLTTWLRRDIGDVYSKTCRWRLGERYGEEAVAGCKVNLALMRSELVTVAGISDPRTQFTMNLTQAKDVAGNPVDLVDGWYNYGKITWKTGANQNIVSEIKNQVGKVITLQLKTPFNIATGVRFDIEPGCDRLKGSCHEKFNNILNFGGFPFVPGTDAMLRTPRAK